MNLRVSYDYRDASNFKQHGTAILPGEVPAAVLALLREHAQENTQILPAQLGLPVLYTLNESHYDDDHIWHELTDVEVTTVQPTITHLSAAEFAEQLGTVTWNEESADEQLQQWFASSPHGPIGEDNDDSCEFR